MASLADTSLRTEPILLFNDECAVCRRFATWTRRSATSTTGAMGIVVQPIGDDPVALRLLDGDLDIWDAYETIHLLMPDGSMKLGGEACAEVLRRLPNTRWFASSFAVDVFGFHPFQQMLDLGYIALSDVRPVLGRESCGSPGPWVRPIAWIATHVRSLFGRAPLTPRTPHSSVRTQ